MHLRVHGGAVKLNFDVPNIRRTKAVTAISHTISGCCSAKPQMNWSHL